ATRCWGGGPADGACRPIQHDPAWHGIHLPPRGCGGGLADTPAVAGSHRRDLLVPRAVLATISLVPRGDRGRGLQEHAPGRKRPPPRWPIIGHRRRPRGVAAASFAACTASLGPRTGRPGDPPASPLGRPGWCPPRPPPPPL